MPEAPRPGTPLGREGAATGCFVRLPCPQVVELLGAAGFDFVAIDAEHAPFDRGTIDLMILAGRAAGVPVMVRVPALDPVWIGAVLDMGAAGVIVPHVRSAADAARAAAATRFAGGRGFSPSTRVAGFGLADAAAARGSDRAVLLWCQIEDAEALDHLDAIAATDGVDALLLGPADLAISLEGRSTPTLAEAATRTIAAAHGAGRRAATVVPAPDRLAPLRAQGFDILLCATDQAMLLAGAARFVEAGR